MPSSTSPSTAPARPHPVPPAGHDTVGCVAVDIYGNVAAGTSTGGITAKRVGRVGDSPIIGSGGYADNMVGGVSCTGHGESIMRVVLARDVLWRLERETEKEQEKTKSKDEKEQERKEQKETNEEGEIEGHTEGEREREGGEQRKKKKRFGPTEAAEASLSMMRERTGGCGGVIVASKDGRLGKFFTTNRMAWAQMDKDGLKSGV